MLGEVVETNKKRLRANNRTAPPNKSRTKRKQKSEEGGTGY
jgi:hypothetical protein